MRSIPHKIESGILDARRHNHSISQPKWLWGTYVYELIKKFTKNNIGVLFLYQAFLSETLKIHRTAGEVRHYLYSSLPRTLAIYLQLYLWDDYHMFLVTLLVTNRLLLNEIYHSVNLPFDWFMKETSGFKLESTVILLLQAKQLTMCVSHL